MQDLLNTYSPIQLIGVAYHLYTTGAFDGVLGTTGA
mgnify:CR=1 FL=1